MRNKIVFGSVLLFFIVTARYSAAQDFSTKAGFMYGYYLGKYEFESNNHVGFDVVLENLRKKKFTLSLGLSYSKASVAQLSYSHDLYRLGIFLEARYYLRQDKTGFSFHIGLPWSYAIGEAYYNMNGNVYSQSAQGAQGFSLYGGCSYKLMFNTTYGIELNASYQMPYKFDYLNFLSESPGFLQGGIRFLWIIESKKSKMERLKNH